MDTPRFEDLFAPASSLKLEEIQAAVPTPLRTDHTQVRLSCSLLRETSCFLLRNLSKKSLLNFARNLYFDGNARWLVGLVDSLVAVVTPNHQHDSSILEWIHKNSKNVILSAKPDHLWPEAMANVYLYSLAFELNRSHGWIQISDPESACITLSVSDIVCIPPTTTETHRNVPVLKLSLESLTGDILINMHVFKYYPLQLGDIQATDTSHFNVVVMPSLTHGLCTLKPSNSGPPSPISTVVGLREYWWNQHGYLLSDDSAMSTITVSICDKELTYPSACVWRHKWSFLPYHTQEYTPHMRERLQKELQSIVLSWAGCSVSLVADRFLIHPTANQATSSRPVGTTQRFKRKRN